MALMSEQPKAVSFGETDLGEDPGDLADDPKQVAQFAAKYQAEQAAAGIHVSTSDAVDYVLKQGGSE